MFYSYDMTSSTFGQIRVSGTSSRRGRPASSSTELELHYSAKLPIAEAKRKDLCRLEVSRLGG